LHGTQPQSRESRESCGAAQQKVLLVDDDPISLEIVSLMLGSDGHQVQRACDGETALRMLGLAPGGAAAARTPTGDLPDVLLPDVLLIDMHMPGLSGESLAEQVRAMAGPRPKLLAMSATLMEARGFDGFLQKPLTMEDLREGMRAERRSAAPRRPKVKSKPPRRRPKAGMEDSGADPCLDQAILGKLARAMPAASLKELYAACIADSRAHAAILEELARAGKPAELPPEAHRIKGAALMLGASRVAQVALSLEGGSCNKEAALHLVAELQLALDELERMLLAGKLESES
jgi:hypothetical protein